MKNIPQRTCSVCRTPKNKNELLRVVKNKDNIINVDEIGKQPGRGLFLKPIANLKLIPRL